MRALVFQIPFFSTVSSQNMVICLKFSVLPDGLQPTRQRWLTGWLGVWLYARPQVFIFQPLWCQQGSRTATPMNQCFQVSRQSWVLSEFCHLNESAVFLHSKELSTTSPPLAMICLKSTSWLCGASRYWAALCSLKPSLLTECSKLPAVDEDFLSMTRAFMTFMGSRETQVTLVMQSKLWRILTRSCSFCALRFC